MATNCYQAGKKTGMTHTTHSMGKKTNATAPKVTASAGKSSGTERKGVSAAAPMSGKGK